jgi:endonuclease/exonuclease/phosphatase family metal-dependent hydrolase
VNKWWITLVLLVLLGARGCWSCSCRSAPRTIRFATFNIEDFPKDKRQIDGAFTEIKTLDASFIAVQEITEPDVFTKAARERLGASWDFIYTDTVMQLHPVHHLGVLYDRDVWKHLSTAVHDETRAGGNNKPTLEVRLREVKTDTIIRILVVHLKAGGDGREIRARQYIALGGILRAAASSGERIVLLGDFNSTDDAGDRGDLAALAKHSGLAWATEPLACSAFWDRDDGCFRSRLDHVVMWAKPSKVTALGACATEGCDRQDSCPLYADEVSDHCPVVIDVAP